MTPILESQKSHCDSSGFWVRLLGSSSVLYSVIFYINLTGFTAHVSPLLFICVLHFSFFYSVEIYTKALSAIKKLP